MLYNDKRADSGPTRNLYVPMILDRIGCLRHGVEVGVPCFHIPKVDSPEFFTGICNSRAKKFGMNGRINPTSLDRNLQRSARNGESSGN